MIRLTGKVILDYFLIAVGSAIMALGIGVFLVDAKVVPGGVSGMSIIVHYLSNGNLPVGLLMWVFNIPLFFWGLKELGRTFAFRTFFAFTTNSIFIDIFRGDFPGLEFIRLQDTEAIQGLLKNDFLFLILIGAALLGIGLGIVFKFRGTTAGSDIVAAIMNKRYGMKQGVSIMIIDFFVIAAAGFVIGFKGLSPDKAALTLTLYALMSLFVSSRIIDIILDGFDYARMAYIISDKYPEIADEIVHTLGRGATAYKTRGVYRNVEREVIMTVVSNKEITKLIDMVKTIDPSAFVVISNVHEVLGEGFRSRF